MSDTECPYQSKTRGWTTWRPSEMMHTTTCGRSGSPFGFIFEGPYLGARQSDRNTYLLPAVLSPDSALLPFAQMRNVLFGRRSKVSDRISMCVICSISIAKPSLMMPCSVLVSSTSSS